MHCPSSFRRDADCCSTRCQVAEKVEECQADFRLEFEPLDADAWPKRRNLHRLERRLQISLSGGKSVWIERGKETARCGLVPLHIAPQCPQLPRPAFCDPAGVGLRPRLATSALNDEEQPLDVVQEVLKHTEVSTTRRHYAPTKSERGREALVSMKV
jgi:integrase